MKKILKTLIVTMACLAAVFAAAFSAGAADNNSIVNAQQIQFNKVVKGSIFDYEEEDYYKINVLSQGNLTIDFTSYMNYYCVVIYDSYGKEYWYTTANETYTGMRRDTHQISVDEGVYYLRVTGNYNYNSTGYPSYGNYEFKLGISYNIGYPSWITSTPRLNLVKIRWEQVDEASGYAVYRRNKNKYTELAKVKGTQYTIRNLDSAKQYDFAVRVYKNVGGVTLWSDYYSIISTVTLPSKTSRINAKPFSDSVKLSWNRVPGATVYRVYLYDYRTERTKKIADVKKTSYTVKNLENNTNYKFIIKAGIYSNGETYWSTEKKEATAKTLVGATKKITFKPYASSVKLSWKAVKGASGYVVYRYDNDDEEYIRIAATNKTTLTVKKLRSGTSYKFAIKAYKKSGNKNVFSDKLKAVNTATKPGAPKLTVKAGAGKAVLKWNCQVCTGYEIYYSYRKDGKYKKIATVRDADEAGATVKKLKTGRTAYFKVRAYTKAGKTNVYGAFSAVRGAKIK